MSEITDTFFKSMDGKTIRQVILEGEAYLKEQAFQAVIGMVKAAAGLSLPATIDRQDAHEPMIKMRITVEERWKDVGKFVVAAGSIMAKADVPLVIKIGQGHEAVTNLILTADTFSSKYTFLMEWPEGQQITARDFLAALELKE